MKEIATIALIIIVVFLLGVTTTLHIQVINSFSRKRIEKIILYILILMAVGVFLASLYMNVKEVIFMSDKTL